MRSGRGSMLVGAAVAALLVLPAVASDNGWVVWPTKTVQANSLRVDDVVGNVRVNVADGPMKLDVSGSRNLVNGLTVKSDGGALRISGSEVAAVNVWDWKRWFDFSHIHDDHDGKLFIKVTVPKGTPVRIEDLVGDATIGDTYGSVRLETTAGDATVGRVGDARISLAGSGKTSVTDVAGELRIDIAGSGRVTAGHAGSVKADIAGSGDAQVGDVTAGVNVDIAGSGDFTARRVNGPVRVDIAGSGNVKIADGVADPLRVDIIGAGDLFFGGLAVNPSISAMGSGNVHIKAYRGKLSNDGMADVVIGDRPIPAIPPTPPVPPIPPVPHVPPVPPVPHDHHGGDDGDDN
ncbi:MAG: DUF2807 domain-containing protein [Rhizomicrobium sp.]